MDKKEYIEREAAIDYIDNEISKRLINELPAADVQEVRHGEWKQIDDDVFCSECGTGWNVIDNCTETFEHCPNCGAKMI